MFVILNMSKVSFMVVDNKCIDNYPNACTHLVEMHYADGSIKDVYMKGDHIYKMGEQYGQHKVRCHNWIHFTCYKDIYKK
jgi:hypothetical protein